MVQGILDYNESLGSGYVGNGAGLLGPTWHKKRGPLVGNEMLKLMVKL
jgi:hypothetical protein